MHLYSSDVSGGHPANARTSCGGRAVTSATAGLRREHRTAVNTGSQGCTRWVPARPPAARLRFCHILDVQDRDGRQVRGCRARRAKAGAGSPGGTRSPVHTLQSECPGAVPLSPGGGLLLPLPSGKLPPRDLTWHAWTLDLCARLLEDTLRMERRPQPLCPDSVVLCSPVVVGGKDPGVPVCPPSQGRCRRGVGFFPAGTQAPSAAPLLPRPVPTPAPVALLPHRRDCLPVRRCGPGSCVSTCSQTCLRPVDCALGVSFPEQVRFDGRGVWSGGPPSAGLPVRVLPGEGPPTDTPRMPDGVASAFAYSPPRCTARHGPLSDCQQGAQAVLGGSLWI